MPVHSSGLERERDREGEREREKAKQVGYSPARHLGGGDMDDRRAHDRVIGGLALDLGA
jgi:hypothetical protein